MEIMCCLFSPSCLVAVEVYTRMSEIAVTENGDLNEARPVSYNSKPSVSAE